MTLTGNFLSVLLYYITDRKQFPGNERDRRSQLLDKIGDAARHGVDLIQLREKDLASGELEALARLALSRIRESGGSTNLLINSRADVALAIGADGVHLRSKDFSPSEVQTIWRKAGVLGKPIIGVSCHTQDEVRAAAKAHADFVVFGPVFAKTGLVPAGVEKLRSACVAGIPVLALGGVTLENASQCIQAGAKGIAAVRLFQENAFEEVVRTLRGSSSR